MSSPINIRLSNWNSILYMHEAADEIRRELGLAHPDYDLISDRLQVVSCSVQVLREQGHPHWAWYYNTTYVVLFLAAFTRWWEDQTNLDEHFGRY